jgi:predicted CXXCH cytochrome family protein
MRNYDVKSGEMNARKGRRLRGRKFLFFPLIFAISLIFATLVFAVNETHLDKSKLPKGCISCHKGHGKRATLMLAAPKEELCFECHGPVKKGGPGEAPTDIYSVLLKKSNHPVLQTSQYHVPGEALPERSSSAPRHVSCEDCHDPHMTTKEIPYNVSRGYAGKRVKIKDVRKEYAVCYLCHSDSANLPPGAHNIAQDFDASNASFHPIETSGKNGKVPSLKSPLSTSSLITCSDCHGNDDQFGPKGPHGSNFEHILKANYSTESGPESPAAYDLCYWCHNRSSILNDDSFKSHKRHVLYENSSCFACHASHGSKTYADLISFNNRIVFPNSLGQLNYVQLLPGKPRCFLNCHAGASQYEHIMKGSQYYVNNNPIPGW